MLVENLLLRDKRNMSECVGQSFLKRASDGRIRRRGTIVAAPRAKDRGREQQKTKYKHHRFEPLQTNPSVFSSVHDIRYLKEPVTMPKRNATKPKGTQTQTKQNKSDEQHSQHNS
jgi:hypothetical protein